MSKYCQIFIFCFLETAFPHSVRLVDDTNGNHQGGVEEMFFFRVKCLEVFIFIFQKQYCLSGRAWMDSARFKDLENLPG